VVLNLHFYDSAIFEVVRVSYLLANGICVLSESDEGDPDVAPFRDGLVICAYADLVERCAALVADEAARALVAKAGQDRMMVRHQADLLRETMGR
ncbi:MAG TPA: glycosyltransferase, partial [Lichenihabitans sp.]|nr:glycosyltransferase [Lichenihabitans sp.]